MSAANAKTKGPAWTPEQKAAIETAGGPLLVSAAAGSGKTAVLTERAVRMLCDPAAPIRADRLLIATFTNAAAAEMRGRISKRLLEEQQRDPGGSARRQRLLLQRAPIGTIDSFCLKLLQQHFSALDIPPDFATADESDLFALRQETLAAVLEQAYADPDFCALADLYGRGRDDAAAGQAVLEVYDFLRALPAPMAALDSFAAAWTGDAPLGETPWGKELFAAGRRAVAYARQLSFEAEKLCDLRPALEVYRPALEADAESLAALDETAAAGDWQAAYDAAQGFAFVRMAALRKASEADKAVGDEVKALRQKCKEIVKKLQTDVFLCTEAEFEADRKAAAPLAAALARAVRLFDERYFAAKLEKKLLDFSDFEHLTLRLLQREDGSRTPLAEQISAGFDAVMVDEYQDTNALQDAIYRCLARPDGSNLFFVGDVKQSIYSFRQADPGVFLDKLDRFVPLGGGFPARIALNANFRSAPGVIAGVNFFFERLMSRQLGGIEYGEDQRLAAGGLRVPASGVCPAQTAAVPGGGDAVPPVPTAGPAGGNAAPLCAASPVLPPCGGTDYPGRVELLLTAGRGAAADAAAIAARVRKMLDEGFLVREKGGVRPVRYEDFCILLRVRSSFALYAEALAAQGVPVYADTAGDLLAEPHIRPLTALLRVLDNPAQDVFLASVMLSGLFGFTPDDLVRLRAGCRSGSLYGALAACAQRVKAASAAGYEGGAQPENVSALPPPGTPKNSALHPRDAACAAFYERLAALRRLARTMPAGLLLERLLAETGYLAAAGVLENGARRREDIVRFVNFAASAAGQSGLAGLVRALDSAERSGGIGSQSAGGARPGCLLITTVHRSKGLEFPVVFVADCTHGFNTLDLDRPMLCHARLGLGFALRDPERGGGRWHTAAGRAIRAAREAEALSEEMRVLYVALTRARDCLFLSLPLADPAGAVRKIAAAGAAALAPGALARAKSPAEWLLAAALGHPGGGLRLAAGLAPLPALPPERAQAAGQLAVTLMEDAAAEPQAPAPPQEDAPLLTAAPDEALLARLRELFGWQYPRAALTRVPAKVSVTALVHREESLTIARPAFLAKGGMSAAEKGTVLHAFLQYADLAAAAADPRAEAQRQQELGLLDPELAAQLDCGALEKFFAGAAFGRLCAAQRVLREYDFITALPAAAAAADKTADYAGAEVLVQGVADLVLVNPDGIEIIDYKTDRGKTAAELVAAYRGQLMLYARAIEKRLALPVVRCTIYSFGLAAELDVPLEAAFPPAKTP